MAWWVAKKIGKKIGDEASNAYNNAPSLGDMFYSLGPQPNLDAAHNRMNESRMQLQMRKDPLDRKINNLGNNMQGLKNDRMSNWGKFKNTVSRAASSGWNSIKNGFTRFMNLFRRGRGQKRKAKKPKRLGGKGVIKQKKRKLIK
jgi:hypothetical protein